MATEVSCVEGCNCKRFVEDESKRNNGTTINPTCRCRHKRTQHVFTFKMKEHYYESIYK